MNFSSLLKTTSAPAAKGGNTLVVGSVIHPRLRSDGGKGLVLVLGRVTRNGAYASRKNPISLTVKIEDLSGKHTTETFCVTDADGVHLGAVNRKQIEETLAQISNMTVTEVK